MSNVELTKLYQEATRNGNDWNWIVEKYREATGTAAKNDSVKQSLLKRISELRKALADHGVAEEKIAEIYPRMRKKSVKPDYAAVIDFLVDAGQMDRPEKAAN
jgi:hemerythrin superfamily protein